MASYSMATYTMAVPKRRERSGSLLPGFYAAMCAVCTASANVGAGGGLASPAALYSKTIQIKKVCHLQLGGRRDGFDKGGMW